MTTGIRKRGDSYEAWVYLKREGKKVRKTFPTEAAAKSWRAEATTAATKGVLRTPTTTTLREAWTAWIEGAKAGTVLNRSGNPFKPSALRAYQGAMENRVLDDLGGARLADIRRADLQALVNRLHAGGLSPSAIQVTMLPMRAIYRQHRDDIPVNPCDGLDLPAIRGRREKIADPREAVKLISALPESDRALWATAFYAGLRRGELQGLRWEDVDLAAGVIRVERGWDVVDGAIEPKSSAGRRRVPIPAALRDHLMTHKLASGGQGIVFTRSDPGQPFSSVASQKRADKAWKAAGLGRLTLHECRHSYASFMIDAGVNSKALQTFMGHSSITVTMDLYGHLMPGGEAEAAALADTYLQAQEDRGADQARAAELAGADTGASLALRTEEPLD
ncbi:MAG: tyrosine-type recombinase/integrase [Actinomycetota bacterium]